MAHGVLRKAHMIVERNIVPPFSDNGWTFSNSLKNIFVSGYELSMVSTKSIQGVQFILPSNYIGKTLSLSVEKMIGDNIQIQLGWYIGSSWVWNNLKRSGSINGLTIPENATLIILKIQSNTDGDNQIYVKNIQVEESLSHSTFDEYLEGNNKSIKIPESSNLCPDFDKWILDGGAYIDESGYLVLPKSTSSATSPFIPVKNASMLYYSSELWSSENSTKDPTMSHYYLASKYYDKAKVSAENLSGWTGNGHSGSFETNTWSDRKGWSLRGGDNIRYVRYVYSISSIHSSPSLSVRNPMLTVNESYGNNFSKFRDVNKNRYGNDRLKLGSRSAVRKYPFIFKRESVEIVDGMKYGINQPRVRDGGILIEEEGKSRNVAPSIDKWTGSGLEMLKIMENEYNIKLYHDISTPYVITSVSGLLNTPHTFSFFIKPKTHNHISCGFRGGLGSKEDEKFDDLKINEWNRIVHTRTLVDGVASPIIYTSGSRQSEFDIKNLQIENGSQPTPFIDIFKPMDKLDIPITLDGEGGSIEIEFEGNDLEDYQKYLFDSNGGRWLIWKPERASYHQLYTNGSSRFNFPSSSLSSGKNKVKILWTATASEAWVNGIKVGSGGHNGRSNATELYLGRRQNDVNFYNAIFYSVIVKDRDGRITYEM